MLMAVEWGEDDIGAELKCVNKRKNNYTYTKEVVECEESAFQKSNCVKFFGYGGPFIL
jgi:hypothetical protein